MIKENSNGFGMQLRLVARPLSDAAAAAKICAVMVENNRSCETTVFDGQRLALNADDPANPASKLPAAKPRRSSRHAAKDDTGKPATSSTLSSFFGGH